MASQTAEADANPPVAAAADPNPDNGWIKAVVDGLPMFQAARNPAQMVQENEGWSSIFFMFHKQ